MDHRNIVAAVETRGAPSEQFGATVRGNAPIPLPPTDPRCEAEFRYLLDGNVAGDSAESRATIELLRLNHRTLSEARASWLDVFLSPDSWETREDLERIIAVMESPVNRRLPEFSFCIASAARGLIQTISNG